MQKKKDDYKRQLTLKGNEVKRSTKEFLYYVKDTETEEAKLKKMEEEKREPGDIKRQKDSVEECVGAKKQCFQNIEKFRKVCVDFLTLLETPCEDEEEQKKRNAAKELPEYTAAKDYIATADDIIAKYGAEYEKK